MHSSWIFVFLQFFQFITSILRKCLLLMQISFPLSHHIFPFLFAWFLDFILSSPTYFFESSPFFKVFLFTFPICLSVLCTPATQKTFKGYWDLCNQRAAFSSHPIPLSPLFSVRGWYLLIKSQERRKWGMAGRAQTESCCQFLAACWIYTCS